MSTETEKLILSSGSETEEFVNPYPAKRRSSLLKSSRRGNYTCRLSLDSRRRQFQIFGSLLLLSLFTYLLSNNVFQDRDTLTLRNEIHYPKVEPDTNEPVVVLVVADNSLNESSTTSLPNSTTINATKSSTNTVSKLEESTTEDVAYFVVDASDGGNSSEEESSTTLPPTSTLQTTKKSRPPHTQRIGCKIPKLNPFDPSVLNISRATFPEAKCRKNYELIFNLEITTNESILVLGKKPEEFGWKECCYNLVFKKNNKSDNAEKFSDECFPIKSDVKRLTIPSNHEFIAIFCNSTKNASQTHIMLDGFALCPSKPEVEARIAKYYNSSSSEDMQKMEAEKFSLVVLGIDAVSHMNFHRIMPKVRNYLIKNLSALWLDGYTKVGDNTFPNGLAVLANLTINESKTTCSPDNYFDTCPLLFKNFSAQGYRTSFGEDSPWMGMFNYVKHGFKYQPTDYYLRPLLRVLEEKNIGIKNDHRGNAHICYGPRLSFQFLLQYMKSFANSMSGRRYFQFLWATSQTHDYVNLGRMGEPFLLEFLTWMEARGHFKDTIFVLTSDHGIRWGPMRATAQGKIEDNMPFTYFLLPARFRKKYSSALRNLMTNRDRLTTPFDIHETFLDIAELSRIENEEIEKRSQELENSNAKLSRGISLFLPIPKRRTCEDAGVEEHYCVCHSTKSLPMTDPEVQQAANYAVFVLNSKISKYSKCAYLALQSVHYALQINNNGTEGKEGEKALDLSFSTSPGNGSFDATVERNEKKEWSISGSISRTNLYGNQSYCVDNSEMKKYCYCLP